ncbi:MAG TPA: MFS transporter [Propionibacteriaceae bacterium]|nr:MFS transporter [Propionibacteriaceae bacterium]
MSTTFASLSIPNYRTYFIGFTISNIAQWMARTAQSWLVLVTLTHGNASALGYLTALNFLPALLLAPWAGTIADRFPKRRIMTTAQVVLGIDAALLATLVLTGHVQLWHVFAIALMDGVAGAFDGPARQAFVSEVVPLRSLSNAISLNSASFNSARLLGPGIAGVLIAFFGTGVVLAINVFSFVSLIVALALLKADQLHPAPPARGRGQLKEGLRYVRGRPDLMMLLGIAFMMGSFGFNFAISNAVMATQAFHKGPGEYGALGSFMGLGALTASILAARRPRPRLRYVLGALAGFTVAMMFSTVAPTFWVFALLQIPVGLAAITVMVTGNTLVQTSISPEMRGRVMSLWGAVLLGGTPFVSPVVGWIGDTFGPRWTVFFQGASVGLTFLVVTSLIMRSDGLRVRFDTTRRAPRLRIVRPGMVTIDVAEPAR